ncbi:MAG: hypothetical protein M3R02_11570 [Chloroflexota bacterium]|nr:hypothetical protein [Chloroflexota bacterium]
MGAVMGLLIDAARAGLEVRVDEDRLVVRGPRSAEDLALRLLDQKAEVVATLADHDAARIEAVRLIFDAVQTDNFPL